MLFLLVRVLYGTYDIYKDYDSPRLRTQEKEASPRFIVAIININIVMYNN